MSSTEQNLQHLRGDTAATPSALRGDGSDGGLLGRSPFAAASASLGAGLVARKIAQRQVQRQGNGDKPKETPGEAIARERAEQAAADLNQALHSVIHVIVFERYGVPVSQATKDQATQALNDLNPAGFQSLVTALQRLGMLEEFLKDVGSANAQQVVNTMDVEIPVHSVGFTGTTEDKVAEHYERGNKIFKPYNLKISRPTHVQVSDSWFSKLLGLDNKSLLGNDQGTFKEADLDKDGAAVDKLVDLFYKPGTLTSFWFSDLVEDTATYGGGGRSLHGQAMRDKGRKKAKGKEAVFVDINAAGHVFAHELGHIIGGKGDEAEHVKGADGTTANGDKGNVMYQFVMPGTDQTKLTPQQIQAFKTGVYARIAKVRPPVGDFPPVAKPGTGVA